jgi:hypothetical protein
MHLSEYNGLRPRHDNCDSANTGIRSSFASALSLVVISVIS